MKVNFNGKKISFNLVRGNFARELAGFFPEASEDDITDTLVKYDSESNTVAVDERAGNKYAEYAAIHECICCGPYKNLAPSTNEPDKRCGLIDKMILESMPESERKLYKRKRIEMFEILIEKNLNPPLTPVFRKSLETLKSLQD